MRSSAGGGYCVSSPSLGSQGNWPSDTCPEEETMFEIPVRNNYVLDLKVWVFLLLFFKEGIKKKKKKKPQKRSQLFEGPVCAETGSVNW